MKVRQRQPALVPLSVSVSAALMAAAAAVAHGQMHHVDAPERVTRAIGVYEWTGELNKPSAARFVPVSLFIDGHFEDAGLYLARPVPFALEPGDVYSLEHAGEPQGLLDLDFAHRVVTGNALADDNPEGAWYAYGKFTPEAPPRQPNLRPAAHPSKIQSSAGPNTPAGAKLPAADADSGEPHLGRRNPGTSTSPSSAPSSAPSSVPPSGSSAPQSSTSASNGSGSSSTTTDSSADDTDRPTLRRRDPSQDAARQRVSGKASKLASVTAAGPALGDDPDRPILGHNSAGNSSIPELTGLPPDLHQAVAVSDAAHRDAHLFARAWDTPAERADTQTAMAALAKARLAEYLTVNQLVASSAPLPSQAVVAVAEQPAATAPPVAAAAADQDTGPAAPPKLQRGIPGSYQKKTPATAPPSASGTAPASPSTATANSSTAPANSSRVASAAAAKPAAGHASTSAHPLHRTAKSASPHPAPLTLGQEEISGFSLSYGGLPTFVYTAAASVQPAKPSTATVVAGKDLIAYVTVVAQRLPTGELQVALSAATDSAHLDRGPRLRLVDAVDPDDSHRASLLFELRGAASRQFALYRLASVHAEQTFTTASLE